MVKTYKSNNGDEFTIDFLDKVVGKRVKLCLDINGEIKCLTPPEEVNGQRDVITMMRSFIKVPGIHIKVEAL